MIQIISRKEIEQALKGNSIVLVEALPQKYYDEGHLPEAVQINHDEVKDKASTLLPDKDALIVTYCTGVTCPNSGYAAENLFAQGYTNIKKYAGGKEDWISANNCLEKSS